MKIAVVDDSLFSRKRTKEKLSEVFGDAEFVEFPDGEAALAGLPDSGVEFVTLDLVMPKVDGFGVLEGLQGTDFNKPVFVVTSDIQEGSRNRCIELGCTDFIDKPISSVKLTSALSKAEII